MEIDRILEGLHVDLDPFALCEVHGTATLWGEGQAGATLHYILAGGGEIAVGNQPPIPVQRGSLVLVPAYRPHRLTGCGTGGEPLPDCRPLDESMAHIVAGQGNGGLAAVCGRLDVSYRGLRSALDLLRTPLAENLPPGDRVRNAMDDLVMELANPILGTKALARSLLEQCLIILLRRRHMAGDPELAWIAGAADESLWQALQIMLDQPGGTHTVETLADQVNMSRSVFAKRFKKAFGRGPIDLLRNIRLNRASQLLMQSDHPVKRIAELVGYRSRATFTRVFYAEFGVSPDRFRRKS